MRHITAQALLALQLLPGGAVLAQQAPISSGTPEARTTLVQDDPFDLLQKHAAQDPKFEKAMAPLFDPHSSHKEKSAALKTVLDSLPTAHIRKEFLSRLLQEARKHLSNGEAEAMDRIELLVAHHADKEQKNDLGQNMMFDAVRSKDPANIIRVAALNVAVDQRDAVNKSPLSYALDDDKRVMALVFMGAPADSPYVTGGDETQLFVALKKGYYDSAKMLLNPQLSAPAQTDTVIHGEAMGITFLQLPNEDCPVVRKLKGLQILLDGGMNPGTLNSNGHAVAEIAIDELKDLPSIAKNDPVTPAQLAIALLTSRGAEALDWPGEYDRPAQIGLKLNAGDLSGAIEFPDEYLKYAIATGISHNRMQVLLATQEVQDWLHEDKANFNTALAYAQAFDPDLYEQLTKQGLPAPRIPVDPVAAVDDLYFVPENALAEASNPQTAAVMATAFERMNEQVKDDARSDPQTFSLKDPDKAQQADPADIPPDSQASNNDAPQYPPTLEQMQAQQWSDQTGNVTPIPATEPLPAADSSAPEQQSAVEDPMVPPPRPILTRPGRDEDGTADPDIVKARQAWAEAESNADVVALDAPATQSKATAPDPQLQDKFFKAVSTRNVADFKALLDADESIYNAYKLDDKLLITGNLMHLIAQYGYGDDGVKMAEALEGKLPLGALTSNGLNEVNIAIRSENEAFLAYLLDKNVAVNRFENRIGRQDENGTIHGANALDDAVDTGNMKILMMLLKKGIVQALAEADVAHAIERAQNSDKTDMADAIRAAKRLRVPSSDVYTARY